MKCEVIVTCVEKSYNNFARAVLKTPDGSRRASAGCTSGVEFAVKRAALKLLGGSEKSLKAVCIEDDKALPRRTKWSVTR